MFKLLNRTSTYLTIKPAKGKAFVLNAKSYSDPLDDTMMSEDIRRLERGNPPKIAICLALEDAEKPDKPDRKKIEKILPSDRREEGRDK